MQVAFYLAGEITQVKESIPWVRCASGNVWIFVCVSKYSYECLMRTYHILNYYLIGLLKWVDVFGVACNDNTSPFGLINCSKKTKWGMCCQGDPSQLTDPTPDTDMRTTNMPSLPIFILQIYGYANDLFITMGQKFPNHIRPHLFRWQWLWYCLFSH